MSGKSRRKSSRSKRRTSRQDTSTVAAQRQAVAKTYKPVFQPKVPAAAAGVPTPITTMTVARYPYLVTELRRIAILAGIVLAILVILVLLFA